MLKKGKFKNGESNAEKWRSILKMEFMSSDESDTQDGEEILVVCPLPWLSEVVIQFKAIPDQEITSTKNPQARRQMKRVVRNVSTRTMPDDIPFWAKH